MRLQELLQQFGGAHSKELGIDLASAKSAEIYKWFVAAVLFGARISERIAIKTHREFAKAGLLTPDNMLDAGWNKLVEILDRGGYARYDFKTATKLLEVNRMLVQQYHGDLNILHRCANTPSDLERRLKDLGKGIGEVTVGIFLRELRGIWPLAAPLPSPLVINAANELGILPGNIKDGRHILEVLMTTWHAHGMKPDEFPGFEAALIRYGKTLRKIHDGSRLNLSPSTPVADEK